MNLIMHPLKQISGENTVALHAASFPGRRRSGLGIQTVMSTARNLAIPIKFSKLCHMTIVKPNKYCYALNVTVIPFQ